MRQPDKSWLASKLIESKIPEHLHDGLIAYIMDGRPTGHFLRAVLENNLIGACGRADETLKYRLYDLIFFLTNYAPRHCWTSPANVDYWMDNGGYNGLYGVTNIVPPLEEGDKILP